MPVRRVLATRKWTAVQVKAVVSSSVWVLTAAAITAGLGRYGLFETWMDRALSGLIAAPLLIAWVLAGLPVTGRQWRRVRGRIRRRGWKAWRRW